MKFNDIKMWVYRKEKYFIYDKSRIYRTWLRKLNEKANSVRNKGTGKLTDIFIVQLIPYYE